MPSRAARWISAITGRGNRYDSRSSHGVWPFVPTSVCASVVDLEGVELPGRAVAAEIARVGFRDTRAFKEVRELGAMLVAELLLDAVRAEGGDVAADVEACLVDRVSERLARVAADDEPARLGHEPGEVTDGALDDDVEPLHRDAAARRGVAVDDEEAAVTGRAR